MEGVGGGGGPISTLLVQQGIEATVVDIDAETLAEVNCPAVRADVAAIPFADASFDGAAAVNCLYFLAEPIAALQEARRVLRAAGLFVASTPSRWNDPELEGLDPRWGSASSFDAEDAPAMVAEVFGDVEMNPWRVVAYHLPDHSAIADYLHAFNVPDWQIKATAAAP